MLQLVFIASCLIAVGLQEESVSSQQTGVKSPWNLLFLRLGELRSLSLSTQGKFSSSLTNLVVLPWMFLSMSISFLYWESKAGHSTVMQSYKCQMEVKDHFPGLDTTFTLIQPMQLAFSAARIHCCFMFRLLSTRTAIIPFSELLCRQ